MSSQAVVLAADSSGVGFLGLSGAGIVLGLVTLVGFWRTVEKAGESGAWGLLFLTGCLAPAAFVPVTRITGRPMWWVLLLFVPIVNVVVLVVLSLDLARSFGKGTLFGLGLWILGFVCYPVLGFGRATYLGPVPARD